MLAESPTRNVTARSNADRQRAYRERRQVGATVQTMLLEAIIHGLDLGGCWKLTDNLPEEENAKLAELTRRLDGMKLVAFRVREG